MSDEARRIAHRATRCEGVVTESLDQDHDGICDAVTEAFAALTARLEAAEGLLRRWIAKRDAPSGDGDTWTEVDRNTRAHLATPAPALPGGPGLAERRAANCETQVALLLGVATKWNRHSAHCDCRDCRIVEAAQEFLADERPALPGGVRCGGTGRQRVNFGTLGSMVAELACDGCPDCGQPARQPAPTGDPVCASWCGTACWSEATDSPWFVRGIRYANHVKQFGYCTAACRDARRAALPKPGAGEPG